MAKKEKKKGRKKKKKKKKDIETESGIGEFNGWYWRGRGDLMLRG